MNFIEKYKEQLFEGLSLDSCDNYNRAIKEIEGLLQKPFFMIDSMDAEKLKANIDTYHNWAGNPDVSWTSTTVHTKRRRLIAIGNKLEELMNRDSNIKEEFLREYGFVYKSPFGILSEKTQFQEVKSKKTEVPSYERLMAFFDQLFPYEEKVTVKKKTRKNTLLLQTRAVVALMCFAGINNRDIPHISIKDFRFDGYDVFLWVEREKQDYLLPSIVKRALSDYMDSVTGIVFIWPDSLFVNRNRNPLSYRDITRMITGIDETLTTHDLCVLGMLRLFYGRERLGNKFGQYNLTDRKTKKIRKRISEEKTEKAEEIGNVDILFDVGDGESILIEMQHDLEENRIETATRMLKYAEKLSSQTGSEKVLYLQTMLGNAKKMFESGKFDMEDMYLETARDIRRSYVNLKADLGIY